MPLSTWLGVIGFALALAAFILAAINYRRSRDRLRATEALQAKLDDALAAAKADLAAAQRAEEERAARVRSRYQGPT